MKKAITEAEELNKQTNKTKSRGDFKTEEGYQTYLQKRNIFGERYDYDKLAEVNAHKAEGTQKIEDWHGKRSGETDAQYKAREAKKASPYDETKAKTYKTKGVAGAKKSAEEMTGIKGLQIYEKVRTARDTTYELRDKDGHVVGTIVQTNVSRESKLTIYKRKK